MNYWRTDKIFYVSDKNVVFEAKAVRIKIKLSLGVFIDKEIAAKMKINTVFSRCRARASVDTAGSSAPAACALNAV